MNKKRNYYLDFWKGLACFGVVYAHTYYPIYLGSHDLGNLFIAFIRFAIPLFFMVSGYYCYYSDNKVTAQKLPGKIMHILKINVYGSAFWFAFQMAIGLFGDSHGGMEGMRTVFGSLFTSTRIINWVVFNEDPFVKILWFLSALLYTYLLLLLINKFDLYRIAYPLAIVCLIVHYIMGNVLLGFGIEINTMYYRNFLFMGFPFFMMGHYIRKNEQEILEKTTLKQCLMMLLVGYVLIIPEWFLLDKTELGIGITITAIAIFLLCIHLPERRYQSFITYIGTELSLFIYIVHNAVKIVMDRVAERVTYPNYTLYLVYAYLRVFLCFAACVVAGMVFYKLLDLIKGKKKA